MKQVKFYLATTVAALCISSSKAQPLRCDTTQGEMRLIHGGEATAPLSKRSYGEPAIIDIAVVYTPAAASAVGGVDRMNYNIDIFMEAANTTMSNSNVKVVFRLVGRSQINFVEPPNQVDSIGVLSHPDAISLRESVGADLLGAITASYLNNPTFYFDGKAFFQGFIVAAPAKPLVFVHELSHVLGAGHPRPDPGNTGGDPDSHAFGWSAPELGVECVMGTSLNAQPWQHSGTMYMGIPFGRSVGEGWPCDNVSSIRSKVLDVAMFRPTLTVDPVPHAPPPACLADLDRNGVVNGTDLAVLAGSWGQQFSLYDQNGDHIINSNDVPSILGSWGSCP